MAVLSHFDNGHSEVIVEFNLVNLRLTDVTWTINLPDGWGIRTQIWRVDIDPVNPVVDRTDYTDGSEPVPGNLSAVEHIDETGGWTYYTFPPSLRFEHEVIPA